MKQANWDWHIDTLDVSLRKKYEQGLMTLHDCARELHKAGWYPFVPSDEVTKKRLNIN